MSTEGEDFLLATAEDHATFDAFLVQAHSAYLNWTSVRNPEVLPLVKIEDLHSHVRRLFVRQLQTIPEVEGQNFSARRPILDHLVFQVVQGFGLDFHAQRQPIEDVVRDIAKILKHNVIIS